MRKCGVSRPRGLLSFAMDSYWTRNIFQVSCCPNDKRHEPLRASSSTWPVRAPFRFLPCRPQHSFLASVSLHFAFTSLVYPFDRRESMCYLNRVEISLKHVEYSLSDVECSRYKVWELDVKQECNRSLL